MTRDPGGEIIPLPKRPSPASGTGRPVRAEYWGSSSVDDMRTIVSDANDAAIPWIIMRP